MQRTLSRVFLFCTWRKRSLGCHVYIPCCCSEFETVVCVELLRLRPVVYSGSVTSRSTDVRCMPGWAPVPVSYRLVHLFYHLFLHFSASIVGLITRTECGGLGRVLSWFIYIFLSPAFFYFVGWSSGWERSIFLARQGMHIYLS
jgi:hypothetical protein